MWILLVCSFLQLWKCTVQKPKFIWMSETLIPFKVVSLVMHTLLPAVLPLLEIFLESFLWNHVQLGCRVPRNVFSWLKSGPFQRHFQFGEQPKITRDHVGRVGSLTNQGNVVFSPKNLWWTTLTGTFCVAIALDLTKCEHFVSVPRHVCILIAGYTCYFAQPLQ